MRSRPSSIHSSPGSSRPGSPQTVGNPGPQTNSKPTPNHQHQQQQQQQQQRRPLGTTTSTKTVTPPSQTFTSRMSQPTTTTTTTAPRGNPVMTSQYTTTRRNVSSAPNSSGLPQPSSSYSSSSSKNGHTYARQPQQQQPPQQGLPTPGFSSRLSSRGQAKWITAKSQFLKSQIYLTIRGWFVRRATTSTEHCWWKFLFSSKWKCLQTLLDRQPWDHVIGSGFGNNFLGDDLNKGFRVQFTSQTERHQSLQKSAQNRCFNLLIWFDF